MKTLTLLRHAKSGWDDPALRDVERPLNARGRRAAVLIGRHLRTLGLTFDHIVASPAVRVVETVAGIEAGYGLALDAMPDRRIYLASAVTLLDVVRGSPPDAAHVLLIGHNPGLEDLVLMLVPEATCSPLRVEIEAKYPTASVARMTVGEDWASLAAGDARLDLFVRPRDLDPTLGPEE